MSSRIENNLQQVINQYFEEDSKKKALEKELKSKNAFIKSRICMPQAFAAEVTAHRNAKNSAVTTTFLRI